MDAIYIIIVTCHILIQFWHIKSFLGRAALTLLAGPVYNNNRLSVAFFLST